MRNASVMPWSVRWYPCVAGVAGLAAGVDSQSVAVAAGEGSVAQWLRVLVSQRKKEKPDLSRKKKGKKEVEVSC